MSKKESKIQLWYSLSKKYRDALRILSELSAELKYKIATILFLTTPEGINYSPRFFQPIDHTSLKDLAIFMDIDGYCSIVDKTGKILVCFYLEAKTNNPIHDFNTWINNPETRNRRIQLEHIIDCNTRTFDMVVYAIHDIPEHEPIPIDKLMIKKVYKKQELNDEKGKWVDDHNDYSLLDLIIASKQNKRGL